MSSNNWSLLLREPILLINYLDLFAPFLLIVDTKFDCQRGAVLIEFSGTIFFPENKLKFVIILLIVLRDYS